jgi:undecaprenyl pyrophosphate phosphatase UppP
MSELDKKEGEYRDVFDKHNALSRFAGFMIVVVFVATFYVGVFTAREIQTELIVYASVSVMVVFGGISLVANNFSKILDIIKGFRSK